MADPMHSLKTSAGMKLSRFLREVGDEHAKAEGYDSKTGKPRIITNMEALARTVWRLALGYEETAVVMDGNGKPKEVRRAIRPDEKMIALLYDRLEGRVGTNADSGKKPRSVSKRMDDMARDRINELAEKPV